MLCLTHTFSKYAWVFPLKDKNAVNIVYAFQTVLNKSEHNPNQIWVDKARKFYNGSFKKWLKDSDIEMYSTHNEGKSVVSEWLIRDLKSNIYKHKSSISKNVYIDKLDVIENEYNNTYHRTNKMKPIDIKHNTYINSSK